MAKEHVTKCSKNNHVVHDEKAWYSLGMSLCPEYLLCYIRIACHVKYCSARENILPQNGILCTYPGPCVWHSVYHLHIGSCTCPEIINEVSHVSVHMCTS